MRYELTEHARGVLVERDIPEEWVARALTERQLAVPDPEDSGIVHYFFAVPERGSAVLRVVVNERNTPSRVVTAFFDRRMKGKL